MQYRYRLFLVTCRSLAGRGTEGPTPGLLESDIDVLSDSISRSNRLTMTKRLDVQQG